MKEHSMNNFEMTHQPMLYAEDILELRAAVGKFCAVFGLPGEVTDHIETQVFQVNIEDMTGITASLNTIAALFDGPARGKHRFRVDRGDGVVVHEIISDFCTKVGLPKSIAAHIETQIGLINPEDQPTAQRRLGAIATRFADNASGKDIVALAQSRPTNSRAPRAAAVPQTTIIPTVNSDEESLDTIEETDVDIPAQPPIAEPEEDTTTHEVECSIEDRVVLSIVLPDGTPLIDAVGNTAYTHQIQQIITSLKPKERELVTVLYGIGVRRQSIKTLARQQRPLAPEKAFNDIRKLHDYIARRLAPTTIEEVPKRFTYMPRETIQRRYGR